MAWSRCLTVWANNPTNGAGDQRCSKLRGKQPKLSARQLRELARMAGTGEYSIAELAEVFTISRATVYRTLQRSQPDQAR